MRVIYALVWLGVVATASTSHAEGASLDASGHLGLGAPLGFAGAALGFSVEDFSLDAGVGAGWAGRQVAVMPRLRVGSRTGLKAAFSAGVSAGEFRVGPVFCFDEPPCGEKDIFTVWGNGDGGIEFRGPSGLLLRLYAGLAVVLNRRHFEAERGASHPNMADGLWLIYAGGSVGFAFAL